MKAIILDYPTISVYVAELPDWCDTPEKTEDYLSVGLGFHLDEINYMVSNDDEIPVYPCGKDELSPDFKRIATL